MSANSREAVAEICRKFGNDSTRMMDIVRTVQQSLGCISKEAMGWIADDVKSNFVDVESVVSFYAFLSDSTKGRIIIRLCNDIIDELHGTHRVAAVLEEELGIKFGQTTADGRFSLEYTPCIGMSDQAPAAAVNEVIVTRLNSDSARELVRNLKANGDPNKVVREFGDGNNAHELVRAMVSNNIRERGTVIFAPFQNGSGIHSAIGMSPQEVIRVMKTSRLRGRGGAGFPAGTKWEFTRGAEGEDKVVVCNADEGEPGTFKDRVILTECPDMVLEGMAIAGYAIGAKTGILYLRAEYSYLWAFLQHKIEERRRNNLLGKNIAGKAGFDFDVRIQLGAGAYVCGEETALLSSCEGFRGDPKTRPPFPAQKGYLGKPTSVNNVETFCCAARIVEKGGPWFTQIGNGKSTGTKLLSVSGDCSRPGVYEVPFGISMKDLLEKVGAVDAAAVQVGGPSGTMISPKDFHRVICFEDLATGGSVMVFGPNRDILRVAQAFMEFFVEESCGYCTPCRVGNVILKKCLDRIRDGKGQEEDLPYLKKVSETVKATSRCGLGQVSPNPILATLANFPEAYSSLIKAKGQGICGVFDLAEMVADAEKILGRKSVHADNA